MARSGMFEGLPTSAKKKESNGSAGLSAAITQMLDNEQTAAANLVDMSAKLADAAERLAAAAERLAAAASASSQAVPYVTVDAPQVTVESADVNVEVPEIAVPPAQVEVRAVFPKKVTKRINRDSNQLITSVDEEWSF